MNNAISNHVAEPHYVWTSYKYIDQHVRTLDGRWLVDQEISPSSYRRVPWRPHQFYRYIVESGEITAAHFITSSPNSSGTSWPDVRGHGRIIGTLGKSGESYNEMVVAIAYGLWQELQLPFAVESGWKDQAHYIKFAHADIGITGTEVDVRVNSDEDDILFYSARLDLSDPDTLPMIVELCRTTPTK